MAKNKRMMSSSSMKFVFLISRRDVVFISKAIDFKENNSFYLISNNIGNNFPISLIIEFEIL